MVNLHPYFIIRPPPPPPPPPPPQRGLLVDFTVAFPPTILQDLAESYQGLLTKLADLRDASACEKLLSNLNSQLSKRPTNVDTAKLKIVLDLSANVYTTPKINPFVSTASDQALEFKKDVLEHLDAIRSLAQVNSFEQV
jgi:hypothetical protein